MKKYWLLLTLVLASCVAKPIISETACNDPLYLSLKAKSIDSMTDREFAYFQMKDRECEEARASANAVKQIKTGSQETALLLLIIDAVALAALALLLHFH